MVKGECQWRNLCSRKRGEIAKSGEENGLVAGEEIEGDKRRQRGVKRERRRRKEEAGGSRRTRATNRKMIAYFNGPST